MSVLNMQCGSVGSRSSKIQSSNSIAAMLEELEPRMMLSAAQLVEPGFVISPTIGLGVMGPRIAAPPSSGVVEPSYVLEPLKKGVAPHASATPAPNTITPAQMTGAYGISNISFGGIKGDGTGMTIGIVDSYDDPNALNDLNTFSRQFGLPTMTLGTTFEKISQTGSTVILPPTDPDVGDSWEIEESLDIEWAHAIAPKAKILLVESMPDSTGANMDNLFAAIDEARTYHGALGEVSVISMSWGEDEGALLFANPNAEIQYDPHLTTPHGHIGITFLVSTGDDGYEVCYPADAPTVVAVGGTTLTVGSNNSYGGEVGWSGSGGGTSGYQVQPAYQAMAVPPYMADVGGVAMRTVPDVSMDADPNSGVAVCDTFDNTAASPWMDTAIGGTSLAAPMWAGLIAIINQGRAVKRHTPLDGATQTLPALYTASISDFNDITTGNNGEGCVAGYDVVTGIGTPVANMLALDMAGFSKAPIIQQLHVNPVETAAGASVTLTATGVAPVTGTITNVTFYMESNGVAGFQAGDTLLGTGTLTGLNNYVYVTSTTNFSPGVYTYYAVATNSAGFSSNAAADTLTIYYSGPAGSGVSFGTYWWNSPGCGLYLSNFG